VTAFAAALRADGLSESSVKRHLSTLRAAARWAYKAELLLKLPTFNMPRRGTTARMKGRPVTGEEFDRLIRAVPKMVVEGYGDDEKPEDYDGDPKVESWRTLLRGLWWSGLRLGEAMALRWDQTPGGVWVELDGRRSVLAFDGESQKSGRVELVPLAPEAVELVPLAPEAVEFLEPMRQSSGYVFAPMRIRGKRPMQRTPHKISQIVSKIGAEAGIVVNAETGKTASAHDLRRAFGFRWARRVMPPELMHLMRHKDVKTTLTFYVGQNAHATAGAPWDAVGANSGAPPVWTPRQAPSRRRNPYKASGLRAPPAGFEPATHGLGNRCSIP